MNEPMWITKGDPLVIMTMCVALGLIIGGASGAVFLRTLTL